MPSFAELQNHFDDLIRKGLEGSVFAKRYAEADPEIAKLKDATGLLAIPPGYVDVGNLTKDQGVNWTRDIESSDTNSLGKSEPTRRDITSDVTGLQFTMQESKRVVFELYDGIDLTAVKQDANGNVSWDKADRPASIKYRMFALFKDGDGADAIYFAKWLPRAEVTDRGEQSWNEDGEVQYPVTITAYNDKTVGTSMRTLWAGPATKMTAMGFPVGA
jgi:hypothetical protein